MQHQDIRVGGTFLDVGGAERRVWAIICGKVYFYSRIATDAPWLFERHAEAPSVEAFAEWINANDALPPVATHSH